MKRKAAAPIHTARQLQALASPVGRELLQALRCGGPATVAELGPRLGRRANSLHYHVRKLVAAGLLQPVDSRRSGARTQTVYDVVADRFVGPSAPRQPRLRALTVDVVASLLRQSTRDFTRGTSRPADVVDTGAGRNVVADRHSAWLAPRQLARVNRLIDELHQVFRENTGTQQGRLYALTTVLTPLDHRKDPS